MSVFTKLTDLAHPTREHSKGVEIYRLPPAGARSAAGKWRVLPALRRAFIDRRADFDAIVCIDYRAIGLAALSARRTLGCAVVLQAATDGVLAGGAIRRITGNGAIGRLATAPVRLAYRSADAYPCISRQIERETLAAGVPRDRVHYLPNPVDVAKFSRPAPGARRAIRERLGIPSDAPVAMFLGRLSREKGVIELLRAWPQVHAAAPDARLLIAGPDMPDHPWNVGPDARAIATAPELGGSVHFAGAVAPDDVPDWLSAADLAVQPSHFEAFGTSAIEAMAAGLPVIAAAVGGLPDFVNSANGALVPAKDVGALAAALAGLLADPGRRLALAAGARATAPAFDLPVVLGRFAGVIDDAVERRTSAKEKTA